YFYADFVGSKVWMLDYDRDEPPSGGTGALVDVSALWQSLVCDPTDPSYLPSDGATDVAGLDRIVSFGEDNAGNLYVVDFGNRSIGQNSFDGQYPRAGLGEIFKIVPYLAVTLTVNRDTGAMTLSNPTEAPVAIRSYSISSAAGAINAAGLATPITGHYDAPPGGD